MERQYKQMIGQNFGEKLESNGLKTIKSKIEYDGVQLLDLREEK